MEINTLPHTFEYGIAKTEIDLSQILSLQQKNLALHLSSEQIREQGFVSVIHDFPLLNLMNEACPHIIAKHEDEVVGYALVMLPSFRDKIPLLIPMFDLVDTLSFQGNPLRETPYFVMGQVCIAEAYRGLGLFDGLYQEMKVRMSAHYKLCVTEISSRNTRSLKAHSRVGFQTLREYTSPEGEDWCLVVWDWS
jgi:hypothetical protein